ncbi:hypothetical protein YB2330_003434 [Saitoella coloradoensis]
MGALRRYLDVAIYRWNVTLALYMLEPFERIIASKCFPDRRMVTDGVQCADMDL